MNHSQLRNSFSRWRKKSILRSLLFSCKPLISIPLLFIVCLLFFRLTPRSNNTLTSLFPSKSPFRQCGGVDGAGTRERFLWYAPHSGFSNQLAELKNAILFAAILNRTLVIPPVLDHHAVALGSCPKFRVADPNELRGMVWDHAVELARSGRYTSMGDIIDLSEVHSKLARTIDFRAFVSMVCGLDLDLACSDGVSLPGIFAKCRSFLSGLESDDCVYAVQADCRTTVWTYKQNGDDILDSFQPEELRRKKKISYIRKRRDIYKALGPGSKAEAAIIIAFGSMFSAPYKGSELYIDVSNVSSDPWIRLILQRTESLPFVPVIVNSGMKYAMDKIKEPYLCAQLRLLDGQFKNHWKGTFSVLKQTIKSLQMEHRKGKIVDPISIFIMTDLPRINWTGTYLVELAADPHSFKLHTLDESNSFVLQTARNVLATRHGYQIGGVSKQGLCDSKLPDILLFLEEAICSCASLGFVGTAGSTIADSIDIMRRNNHCNNSL